MTPEAKRALIAALRRVIFAGLIILGAWLVLMGLREAIPANIIDLLNQEIRSQGTGPVDLTDWSRSWWTREPVSSLSGQRLGPTVRLVLLGGLLSLVIAAVLLFLGLLISRLTERSSWLAQVRRVLRLVLVSGGVTTSIFMGTAIGALLIVFSAHLWGWVPPKVYEGVSWLSPAFVVSLLPAWLLVQAGHGELANWLGGSTGSCARLARHLTVRLVIRLLKLVGAIIVVTVLVDQTFATRGLGTLMVQALFQRDFPVVFGIAWVFVLIVVLAKLAADLIGIAYNHFGRPPVPQHEGELAATRVTIPRGWLVFCLVLVLASIMVAVVGPAFAPYGYNEMNLADRLAAPSAGHILGTDNLGRDVFSRLLFALRTDLATSLMAAAVVLAIATGWAMLAAYVKKGDNWLGDTLEDLVMLPRDVLCAFPWLVLLLLWMSMVGPGLVQVALAGSLVLLPRTVGMMQEAYCSPPVGQGWPYSVLWSVPVMFILAVAGGILYTSSLSYLGFGIPPPTPELGGMLSGTGLTYMFQTPWMALWPGLVLAFLFFVWLMAGDALLERLGFRSKAVWAKAVE
jgi:peptide/nickel transport system permease protein